MSRSTRALVVQRPGGRDVLEVVERAVPAPGPGEAVVRVGAVGVNFIDVYRREGVYPTPTPFVACSEGAGEVVAVGAGTDGVEVGDRIAWADVAGSGAGLVVVPVASTVPVPDGIELETAAALMLQGLTAHYLVTSTFPVQAGQTALVHSAAGGVGQLLVQLVKARGGRVIATAGSAAKLEIAAALGADHTLDSSRNDLAAAVRELTDGVGVDVVYDGVGAATFDASLDSLRRRGMLVVFGAASGQVPPFDVQRLNQAGSVFLTRPTLADHIAERDELLRRADEVFAAVLDGTLRPSIGGRYPLDDARAAYADLEGRRSTGKLLLIPG